jgi:EAL domain-containing protein (putative c-di-GMP-specific phosphodiesterase class I)
LLRWNHPQQGLLSPHQILKIAEDSGLIEAIDWRKFELSCRAMAGFDRDDVFLTVNVSALHLGRADFAQRLLAMLERTGLPSRRLVVEVTEGALFADPEQVRRMLHGLREHGVRAALDDFGTGYSSLSQLYKLNFDGLKIDRAFIVQLGKTEGGIVIVRAIVTMARALAMRVVAEGVETMEQVDMLRALDCDEIQGWLISKAMPPAESQPVARNFVLQEA